MNGLLLPITPPVCILILEYDVLHVGYRLLDLCLLLALAVLFDDTIRQLHPNALTLCKIVIIYYLML